MELNKIVFVLKGIYAQDPVKSDLLNLINFSTIDFEEYTEHFLTKRWQAYHVTIHTAHEIFIKHHFAIESFQGIIKTDLNSLSPIPIEEVDILPDYNKLEIINSDIRPISTKWDEINKAQTELITQLQKTATNFEIKNIGNTSRVILKNLAKLVFKKERHTPSDKSIDVSGDKYKNQLHSYIDIELSGKSQSEFRGFADAAIEIVDKSIILANAVTHRSKSEKRIAEICVTGIVTVISIVTFIEQK